ncbi:TonB-dependent receptor [Morganella morganii subsp. morganii]|uniref:TonB-dependent receptor domain-containing protein n=1 Tax=Morganella morganii TaxID=582 RepID=UPI0006628827|nr:TonB-dependent receptor [Morganella morganii]AVD59403.1 TonB-dependent receptor [Morganella morganii]MBT0427209.1 TonB-dependent receptor [Morganella morganii subsp. morganii]MBT0474107.1 TonB-dependent receptor [Morganella morganii subsp. morganii]MBT0502765.1 TonB-dependent receptor [Morganella morganii subsp. morganii]MBT0521719.1 TonB-dependent receptor [Morganella morganii subsp. morganii]
MNASFKRSLLAVAVMSAATAAYAENKDDTIVVTASGFAQEMRDAPASITVITKEQLQNKPAANLIDMVKYVEGVSVIGGSLKPDISIRGLSGDYTLIMVDGRRQNSRESRPNGSGGYEAGFIPPVEAIERIEVIRGPMSSLYGSDAMGGVINIITKAVADEWHGSMGMGGIIQESKDYGNSANTDFYVSGPLIKDKLGLQVYGGLNYRREDKLLEGTPRKDDKNITAKLAFTPIEGQKFLAEVGRSTQEHTSTPGKSIDETTTRGGIVQKNNKSEVHNNRNHWALTWKGDWDEINSEVSVYQENTIRKTNTGKWNKVSEDWVMAYEARQPEVTNTVVDGKVTAFLPSNVLTVGGQYQYAKLKDDSVIKNKQTVTEKMTAEQKALFVEDEFSVTDDLTLTGGLRMDDHEFYGKHWNPRAYAVYKLTDEITIKGGVAKAFRAPTLRELSPNFGTSTQGGAAIMYGNRDLKPETSVTEELGIAYDHESGFSASATLFNTEFKNKLTSYQVAGQTDPLTGLNMFIYDNVGKANIRGVEMASRIPVAEKWNLNLNYTFTDSERKSDDEKLNGKSLKGQPLEMTPRHMANARLDWQYRPDMNFYTQANYTGKQVWAAQRNGAKQPRERSGITTLDLGMTYQVMPNALLNFAVLNIANEKGDDIETNGNWQIDEGRRYWANLKLNF